MEKQQQLEEWVKSSRPCSEHGRVATYIPALANGNRDHLGVVLLTADGTSYQTGEFDVPFTLQSISKVFSFITACELRGIEYMLQHVDVEPTGDPFNSIVRLEMHKPGRPFNPMINAGAITVASLLPGETADEKVATVLDLMETCYGSRPTINEEVFISEWQTANRNRALAYYLKDSGYLGADVETSLEAYLKLCSIEINAQELAKLGLVIALNGFNPTTGSQVFSPSIAKLTKALMLTCGMYDYSGKFAAFVGVPAKSGVSGGIVAAIPHRGLADQPFEQAIGIGIFSPAIDEYGNSVAGVEILKQMSKDWRLNIF